MDSKQYEQQYSESKRYVKLYLLIIRRWSGRKRAFFTTISTLLAQNCSAKYAHNILKLRSQCISHLIRTWLTLQGTEHATGTSNSLRMMLLGKSWYSKYANTNRIGILTLDNRSLSKLQTNLEFLFKHFITVFYTRELVLKYYQRGILTLHNRSLSKLLNKPWIHFQRLSYSLLQQRVIT